MSTIELVRQEICANFIVVLRADFLGVVTAVAAVAVGALECETSKRTSDCCGIGFSELIATPAQETVGWIFRSADAESVSREGVIALVEALLAVIYTGY